MCVCVCVWPNKNPAHDIFTAGKWRVNLWCLFRGLRRLGWPRVGHTHAYTLIHTRFFSKLIFPALVQFIFMQSDKFLHGAETTSPTGGLHVCYSVSKPVRRFRPMTHCACRAKQLVNNMVTLCAKIKKKVCLCGDEATEEGHRDV